jgi:endonuclease/exonuclease/phosphatase family metal-dependent hydrolase
VVRLATFNLKHGAPAHGTRGDPLRTAAACASLEADVLALQEVDSGVPRSGRADLPLVIAEACGMEVVFAQTMPLRGGRYGNALLVRGDLGDVEVLPLRGGRRFWVKEEPRNAIVATAEVNGLALSVAATHLAVQRSASRRQLTQVAETLLRRPRPRALLGDLNRTPSEVRSTPGVDGLVFAEGPPSFPALKPVLRIDHVGVEGIAIRAVEVRRLSVSDHLALIVEVEPLGRGEP